MLDVAYLVLLVAFFAVMVGVVGLCRRVVGTEDYETPDPGGMGADGTSGLPVLHGPDSR